MQVRALTYSIHFISTVQLVRMTSLSHSVAWLSAQIQKTVEAQKKHVEVQINSLERLCPIKKHFASDSDLKNTYNCM